MAQVINTNYLSLTAQNNLNKSQSMLGSAIERLSSGLRINSAKDDAAGQAIANRFTANISGLTQAARNANDGISIAQTTEGALNEINNNLQRIRELSVQAANGTNSESDLKSIQAEITQRLDEIDRVSTQTQFNGVNVLAKDSKLALQVGANDGERIDIDLNKVTKETLGLGSLDVTKSSLLGSEVEHDGKVKYVKENIEGLNATADIVAADTAAGTSAVKATALVEYVTDAGAVAFALKGTDDKFYEVSVDRDPGVGGVGHLLVTMPTAPATALTGTAETAAKAADLAGHSFTTDGVSDKHEVIFTVTNGTKNLEGGAIYRLKDEKGADTNNYVYKDTEGKFYDATLAPVPDGTGAMVFTVGTTARTDAAALTPLKAIDDALAQVDGNRSQLGAVQNRLTSAVNNLNNTVNNLSSARSRIEDADYATEVSNMTRSQILQQAGTAVLAQANQVPQSVLSLLR